MGAEVLALATAGMGAWQGMEQSRSYNQHASALERDGMLMESEHMRDASRIEDEGRRFADEQKMAYIGSGVEIGGSAVVTLAQTDKWARAEADAVRDRGRAIRDYHGRSAKIARGQGRASFVSGLLGGLAQGAGIYAGTKAPTGGVYKSNDPYRTGINPPTAKQMARPGAMTRIRP